ncbi:MULTISPECIES: M23 family metallopeptidase [Rothia]|jgi:membrane protein related to metalloendopeptidase|uniref:M23 family metallopeptidase n=1 Tax=Rothia TaxID=32207 RepID=UPI001F344A63|nr:MULTISPECIES: M23 family metallopeptidase [Rothia]
MKQNMKTLATTLRRTMLVACYLLGALVSAGGQGYAGSQGYLGSQDYSGWLSFTGGAGVTDGATSGAQAPSSTHVPSTVELTASRLRYRSPTADSRPRVIRPFEKPAQRWSAGHRGVDLAVPENDRRVYAPAPGKVVFSGTVVNRKVLVIAHPDGRRSTFEPMNETLPVGTTVTAGDVIGTVADAAGGNGEQSYRRCSAPCLYWGVRQGGARRDGSGKTAEYINPMSLLGSKEPSILLPVPGGY